MQKKNLPILKLKEEIIRTVQNNPITIIEGSTGCGKSTQVPLFMAEAGYRVLVTQPRILATISLAKLVANHFGTDSLGTQVGYSTGLQKNFSKESQIIFLTDGSELIRLLNNKEEFNNTVLILDEVHEWNTNMDLLLSYARELILNGEDLKLVLMSATMESNKLSNFLGNAPIIKIPSKSYYVTTIKKPAKDLEKTIINLIRSKQNVLVFLPGKSEISALRKQLDMSLKCSCLKAELISLHADIPSEQQHSIFKKYCYPKLILATNIAQTSITIPDIDAVVDTGLDKQMQLIDGIPTLTLSNISKADLAQRKGRVGRCAPGIYYLCSDFDYDKRLAYSNPKIQSSNLENIMLTLISSSINITSLKLFHSPLQSNINTSLEVLKNLGAIDNTEKITDIGKAMCLLPLSARSSRILVEAKKYDIEYDVLLCCLLQEFGMIYNNNTFEFESSFNSDLLCQATLLKKILLGERIPKHIYENLERATLKRIKQYLPKLLSILKIGASTTKMNAGAIKKCLALGFPDQLYILQTDSTYINTTDTGLPAKLCQNSSLLNDNYKYIVGAPMNFYSYGKIFKRVLLPTAFTLEEILECYSHLIKESYSTNGTDVYKHLLYNNIEITSYCIGTTDELKLYNPFSVVENNEYFTNFRKVV